MMGRHGAAAPSAQAINTLNTLIIEALHLVKEYPVPGGGSLSARGRRPKRVRTERRSYISGRRSNALAMPGSNAIMPRSGPHPNGIECRNHPSRWRYAESSIWSTKGSQISEITVSESPDRFRRLNSITLLTTKSNGCRYVAINSPPCRVQLDSTNSKRRRFWFKGCVRYSRSAFCASSRSCTPSSK